MDYNIKHKDGLVYVTYNGNLFTIDHTNKIISCPQSVEYDDYPEIVKKIYKESRYFIQLTIE